MARCTRLQRAAPGWAIAGCSTSASRRVVAAWRLRRWITCVLSFKDRQREVFAPKRYSELFFLDEATSLAAGHRPCAECRRSRYEEFRAAWNVGQRGRDAAGSFLSAEAIDGVLHDERLEAGGVKKAYVAVLSSLPDGAMVEHAGGAAPALEREALALELLRLRSRGRRAARDGGRRADPTLDRARDPSGLRTAGTRDRRPALIYLTAASSTGTRTAAP